VKRCVTVEYVEPVDFSCVGNARYAVVLFLCTQTSKYGVFVKVGVIFWYNGFSKSSFACLTLYVTYAVASYQVLGSFSWKRCYIFVFVFFF